MQAPPSTSSVVLIADTVEVPTDRASIERQLCNGTSSLLPLARAATGDGQGQIIRVGPRVHGHPLGVPVTVLLAPCWARDGKAAIPIRWEAASFGSLFPVLDGTLLLSTIDESRCRLSLEASYRVPLDRLGVLLDRALLHRVAETTVHSFLHRLSQGLVQGP